MKNNMSDINYILLGDRSKAKKYYGKGNKKFTLVRTALVLTVVITAGYNTIRPNFIPVDSSNKIVTSTGDDHNNMVMFEKGQHVLSVPLENKIDLYNICQFPYYDGYRCIGVETTGGNRKIAVYVNNEAVMCSSNGLNSDGEAVYNSFGTPEQVHSYEEEQTDGYTFKPYEHIVSVPLSDPNDDIIQYDNIEGYELVDVIISATNTNRSPSMYKGSVAIYTNTVPVKCNSNKFNNTLNTVEYLEFGTPLRETKTLS